ncbi:MAG TPA: acyl-CoA desaturase [Ilumatobacteraceae bacterium]|nr:acyl-CoA desaturase [Ilumatobacteraceae bacterium]
MLAVAYFALVVANLGLLVRLGAAALVVVSSVALATGVLHDANHGSFSRLRWLNRVLACSSDALGASSFLWRIQHNQLHHNHTNVVGFDADVELGPWARVAPAQPWRPRYRWQHVYIWPLYGFLVIKNLLVSDLTSLVQGRIGHQPIRTRITAGVIVRIALGKCAHLAWAIVIPLMFNPWWAVLAFYMACSWTAGLILAVIFQVAHCVDAVEAVDAGAPRRGQDFAAHQLRTTVDIASSGLVSGPLLRWIAGGLDHQIEHHLAPGLPHTIYPTLAARFRAALAHHDVGYRIHSGPIEAIRSHARWLRAMGAQPAIAPQVRGSRVFGDHHGRP